MTRPRLCLAMVEATLTELVTLGVYFSPDAASEVDWVGPSKKPLKIAPRQIAVRL